MKTQVKKDQSVLTHLMTFTLTREACKHLKGGGVIVTMDDTETDVD